MGNSDRYSALASRRLATASSAVSPGVVVPVSGLRATVAALVGDEGFSSGRCAGITLVASDRFLGEVKAHLSAAALERVLRTVAADYTALSDAELAQCLAAG